MQVNSIMVNSIMCRLSAHRRCTPRSAIDTTVPVHSSISD